MHRDVKPQNVLIDAEGSAKVTDFGIARSLRDDGLTADGRVLGTTDYVSPEQALGHDVNGQSDIYSLGVVLYEMLTGGRPVPRREPDLRGHEARARGPAGHPAAAPGGVGHARRGARPDDGQGARRSATPTSPSLIADLEEALAIEAARAGHLDRRGDRGHPHAAGPAPRRRLPFRMRHPIALLAVIALLGVGAAIVALCCARRGRSTPRAARARARSSKTPAGTKVVSVAARLGPRLRPAGRRARSTPTRRGWPSTATRARRWTTESYRGGIQGAGKPGVGIYIDAKPKVDAVAMQINTPEPGWTRDDLRRARGPAAQAHPGRLDQGRRRHVGEKDQRFKLDTGGTAYRYYLVWITAARAATPSAVEISEIRLFQKVRRALRRA